MTAPREVTDLAGTEGVEIPEDVGLAVSDYGRACEYVGELAHRPGTERATREAGEARQEADREIVKALTFWKARAEAAERERERLAAVYEGFDSLPKSLVARHGADGVRYTYGGAVRDYATPYEAREAACVAYGRVPALPAPAPTMAGEP